MTVQSLFILIDQLFVNCESSDYIYNDSSVFIYDDSSVVVYNESSLFIYVSSVFIYNDSLIFIYNDSLILNARKHKLQGNKSVSISPKLLNIGLRFQPNNLFKPKASKHF